MHQLKIMKVSLLIALLSLSLGGLASPARSSELFAFADVFPGYFSPDAPSTDGAFGQTNASASLTSNFGSSTFSGAASASVSFTELAGRASADLTNFAPQSFAEPCSFDPSVACSRNPASAEAGYTDTVTIRGGMGDAFLGLGFDVSGTSSVSSTLVPAFDATAGATLLGIAGQPFEAPVFQGHFSGDGQLVGLLPFTFDVPLTFSIVMIVSADPFDFSAPSSYDYSGIADFGSTFRLASFRVFEDAAQQNEIANILVDAESGTRYLAVNAVPEPGTVFLVLLSVLGWRRSRT